MTQQLKKLFSARNIFIAILTLSCLLTLWWTAADIRSLYRSHERLQLRMALKNRQATPEDIQPWMTFNYINVIFKLPPAYLQNALHINDPHYPSLQLSRYARSIKIDQQQFLKQVQTAVTNYQH